ncbi:MAG: glycosyltransferase [Candidatus Thermoplasmatota archaeon]|nr:glycosyltransferase [Candidatus Thermoplasmatota archaeon]
MNNISQYKPIVGEEVIEDLYLLAEKLSGKVIQNISATAVGGGVAEILHTIIPRLKDLGVDARWDLIKGGEVFFKVTKKIHNALHNRYAEILEKDFEIYLTTIDKNAKEISFYGDIIFVHDPQPAALIQKKAELHSKWIWRCHIDLSEPQEHAWNFLKKFITQYDASVFTASQFAQPLPIPQVIIPPSIDPLSDKNKELSEHFIERILDKHGIKREKPIITQVSRFDKLKDPLGVIETYRTVKKSIECQLLLIGGSAADDPEGSAVLAEVNEKATVDRDIHILTDLYDEEVNALQRASDVILQKSIKEGFGLTVTEALWKEKPVVASATGGIPLQIKHNVTGLLCHSISGAAYWVKQLLKYPKYAKELGRNGREHVKYNFLITRHIKDCMLLFLSMDKQGDIIQL